MDLTLYDIQKDNEVMSIKESFEYYDEGVQQELRQRNVTFYTREALFYSPNCQSDKKTIIQLIEENRAILLGTPGNPGGAANWVQGAKDLTVFLMLFQAPLLYIHAYLTVSDK